MFISDNPYDRYRSLVDGVTPDRPSSEAYIENLRCMIQFADQLTDQQKLELNVRLYFLKAEAAKRRPNRLF